MDERYTVTLEIPHQHDLGRVEVALYARLNRLRDIEFSRFDRVFVVPTKTREAASEIAWVMAQMCAERGIAAHPEIETGAAADAWRHVSSSAAEPNAPPQVESGDYRVSAELDTAAAARKLAKALGDFASRDGHTVFAYPNSFETALEIRAMIDRACKARWYAVAITVERWNPGAATWQDPLLPVEPAVDLAPRWFDLDRLRWEVRAKCRDYYEAQAVCDFLWEHGEAVVAVSRARVIVGAGTQGEAATVAESISSKAPYARIEIRPLSRMRRWLLKQGLGGNYASQGRILLDPYDSTGGGGGGGGNGGGDGGA
jgi:hypothetical protein